jgi:hypothetical protein
MNFEDKSKIEELKKSLYSRTSPEIRTKRRLRFLKKELGDIKTDWEHPKDEQQEIEMTREYDDHSMSFFNKFFIGSLVFFIIALGIGAYLFFNGANIVSANNIDITVSGPISVAGGTKASFDIQVFNKNNIQLNTVDMAVDFPSGVVDVVDTSKELKQYRELVGDIKPGGIGQKTVSAVLYGEENSKKEMAVTISYRVNGSSAVFQKQKTFEVIINSSPLSLTVDSYKEITAGEQFEMKVNISSNSNEIIKNLILKTVYPFGFEYISSEPKTVGDSTTWNIGDIPPSGKKTVIIRGKLQGQNDETRVFRFQIGSENKNVSNTIGTEFVSYSEEISIRKPFLNVGIDIDNNVENTEYIGSFDSPENVSITWFNNLDVPVNDAEIHVKLSGNAYDKISVSPDKGNFKSADNEIVWNKITNEELSSIPAGGSGKVSFNIVPKEKNDPKGITNPGIKIDVSVSGKRLSETNVPESIASGASRKVKLSSKLNLSSQIVRSSGPFQNTGPVPPKAEKETTYTVIWTVDNTVNTISGAEVKSSLPAYVNFVGKTSPSDEDIQYNPNTHEIVWNVGNVDTQTLRNGHRRQVSFQISFTPSISQVNTSPVLINKVTLTGQDDFTNAQLISNQIPLTTSFSSDPAYRNGDEMVGK